MLRKRVVAVGEFDRKISVDRQIQSISLFEFDYPDIYKYIYISLLNYVPRCYMPSHMSSKLYTIRLVDPNKILPCHAIIPLHKIPALSNNIIQRINSRNRQRNPNHQILNHKKHRNILDILIPAFRRHDLSDVQ